MSNMRYNYQQQLNEQEQQQMEEEAALFGALATIEQLYQPWIVEELERIIAEHGRSFKNL